MTKNLKYILIVFSVIFCLAGLVGFQTSVNSRAYADGDPYIEFTTYVDGNASKQIVSDGNAQVGATFDVTYKITHNAGINSILLVPSYDANKFVIDSVTTNNVTSYNIVVDETTVLGSATVTEYGNGTTGNTPVKIVLESTGTNQNPVYDGTNENGGTFLTITYRVKQVADGNYSFGLKLTAEQGDTINDISKAYYIKTGSDKGEQNEVEIRFTPATVTIATMKTASVVFGSNAVNQYSFVYNGSVVSTTKVVNAFSETPTGVEYRYTDTTNNDLAFATGVTPTITWYAYNDTATNNKGAVLDGAPVNPGKYLVGIYVPTNGIYYAVAETLRVVEITKIIINITINDASSAYGDNLATLTSSATAQQITDLGISLSTTATNTSDVGTYTITATYTPSQFYNVNITDGTYTITKKAITITALNQSAPYTGTEPEVDQTMYSVTPNVTLVGGVDVVIAKEAGTDVGTYTLTPSLANNNYTVTAVDGTFEITTHFLTQQEVNALVGQYAVFKAYNPSGNDAELTISEHQGSYTKTYDGENTYVYVVLSSTTEKISKNVNYKINNGNYAVIEAEDASNFASYGSANARVDTVVIQFTPATGYALADGVNANYTITLTVSKAPLTITASAEVEYNDNEPYIDVNDGSGWVNDESYETYDDELEMDLEDYVSSNYTKGQNAGTSFTISWNNGAETAIEAILTNYDVTLTVAQNLTVAKCVVYADDYDFTGYTGTYNAQNHNLIIENADSKISVSISDKATVKDVADSGTYTATITLADSDNYTFDEDAEGWTVSGNSASKQATVLITAKGLAISADYAKKTATFSITGFAGQETVDVLENLVYAVAGTNLAGNVYTVSSYIGTAQAVSATSSNTNYTITGEDLRNIVKVEYVSGSNVSADVPETEVMFSGFTAEEPNVVSPAHYTFKRFAETNSLEAAAFDFTQEINGNKVLYVIWEENAKFTITLYYMIDGDSENATEISTETALKFYSDDAVNYSALPTLSNITWFNVEKWYTDEAITTKFVDGSYLSANTTLYANYKFNIGIGDVNGDGSVTADDITLYRQWIVGGYTMTDVTSGNEYNVVTANNFDANARYFISKVADINDDANRDIRDVSITRMAIVGGYTWDNENGYNVTGNEIIRNVNTNALNTIKEAIVAGKKVTLTSNVTGLENEVINITTTKNVNINLGGNTLTVSEFNVVSNNRVTITVTNGTIVATNGITISAPNGNVVLTDLVGQDENGNIILQAASNSLHLNGVVAFKKVQNNEVVPAEVKVAAGTHIVVEEKANLQVEKLVVVEVAITEDSNNNNNLVVNVVENPTIEPEISIDNFSAVTEEIIVEGNATTNNEITTLDELREAVSVGGSYKLMDDFSFSGSNNRIRVTKDITIDLNGYSVTSTNEIPFVVLNGATLTIKGNGNVNGREACVLAFDGSSIVINGGNYTCTDNFVIGTNGTSGLGNNKITINAGTFNGGIITAGYVACGIYVANSDTVVVNGGTFNITNGVGILARSGNTTIGENVVFNVTGNGELGKVGDSRVVLPAGEVLVIDYAANYPGGVPTLVNASNYEVYALVDDLTSLLAVRNKVDTIVLAGDISYNGTLQLNNDAVLNLNGYTITGRLSVFNGNVTINNGKVVGEVDAYDGAVLTLGADLTVENNDDGGFAVVVWGEESSNLNPQLHVYGNISAKNTNAVAISGNGTDLSNATCVIYSGANVSSAKDIAIYWPNDGTLNVKAGATVTGATAIYIKSGTVSIENNANITSNLSEKRVYAYNGNGANATGDAIVIDNCYYPGGNANVTISGTYDVATYWYVTTEQQLLNAIAGNGNIQLGKNISASQQFAIERDLILDLNGKKITYTGDTVVASGLLGVKRGATLTINDTVGTGKIEATSEKIYAAVALTLKDEPATGDNAKIVVNGGTLEGYYYGIVGNGSRHDTEIVVNNGTLYGVHGSGIYNPQDGLVTINGGNIKGLDTAIEIRAGELVINNGVFEALKQVYSAGPNGSGTTIEGAIIAISQHTTNKNITVTINDGTFVNGIRAIAMYDTTATEHKDSMDVTINGGTFNSVLNNQAVTIYVSNGNLTINGGEFNSAAAEDDGFATIYAIKYGKVTINDGVFKAGSKYNNRYWTLNIYNSSTTTATLTVNGGQFVEFDPSNPNTDDNLTYVANGYKVVTSEVDGKTVYTVIKE